MIGAIAQHAEARSAGQSFYQRCTLRRAMLTPHEAIDCYWPRSSRAKAHAVAECESTASAPLHTARTRGLGRWARDYASGSHWGIFQLGAHERATYGPYHLGSSAWRQVMSARRLHAARGWQPWSCA